MWQTVQVPTPKGSRVHRQHSPLFFCLLPASSPHCFSSNDVREAPNTVYMGYVFKNRLLKPLNGVRGFTPAEDRRNVMSIDWGRDLHYPLWLFGQFIGAHLVFLSETRRLAKCFSKWINYIFNSLGLERSKLEQFLKSLVGSWVDWKLLRGPWE